MTEQQLFAQHVTTVSGHIEAILTTLDLPGLVIDAGPGQLFFEDDQHKPFRPYHHFSYLCPHRRPHHQLVVTPGEKPKLLFFQPEDFWEDFQPIADEFWSDSFAIEMCPKPDDIWAKTEDYKGYGYLGESIAKANDAGLKTEVKTLVQRLNWHRLYKTPYEAHCLDKASAIGARGHIAAKEAFLNGESEFGIHLAYLKAVAQTDEELPYTPIIALNEKSAVLHYHYKRHQVENPSLFLIDAGANYNGYASDITRTYVNDNAHPVMADLVGAIDWLEQQLCGAVEVGTSFAALHATTNLAIGQILIDQGILTDITAEDAVANELTKIFMPHGLGHALGIFVHDVGAQQKDPEGNPLEPDPNYPKLRTSRAIEPGNYYTIEPGLYFIDMLLRPERDGKNKAHFNWELIDQLLPLGGIRIEDNILVTEDGPKNLTRQYLPQ